MAQPPPGEHRRPPRDPTVRGHSAHEHRSWAHRAEAGAAAARKATVDRSEEAAPEIEVWSRGPLAATRPWRSTSSSSPTPPRSGPATRTFALTPPRLSTATRATPEFTTRLPGHGARGGSGTTPGLEGRASTPRKDDERIGGNRAAGPKATPGSSGDLFDPPDNHGETVADRRDARDNDRGFGVDRKRAAAADRGFGVDRKMDGGGDRGLGGDPNVDGGRLPAPYRRPPEAVVRSSTPSRHF